jgi:hypothetical protein
MIRTTPALNLRPLASGLIGFAFMCVWLASCNGCANMSAVCRDRQTPDNHDALRKYDAETLAYFCDDYPNEPECVASCNTY